MGEYKDFEKPYCWYHSGGLALCNIAGRETRVSVGLRVNLL